MRHFSEKILENAVLRGRSHPYPSTKEIHFMKFLRVVAVPMLFACSAAWAEPPCTKDNIPNYAALKTALDAAVADETTGLNLHAWATLINRDGYVCAIAYSGTSKNTQWTGSRVISAQKANTAVSFSLDSSSASNGSGRADGLALSTANLWYAVQPGGSLFGLQESNPVDVSVAYKPSMTASFDADYGSPTDPMVDGHSKIGGVNVFGGGLALYDENKVLRGGVGVSGDTSCADHRIAWRVRHNLGLDHLQGIGGVSGDPNRPDNMVFDLNAGTGKSSSGFGHPHCLGASADGDPKTLPAVQ
jgi:hypothetical protein